MDYKSGREEVTSEEVAEDIAMNTYMLLAKRNWPEKSVYATLTSLRGGRSASASRTEAELEEFEKDLVKLGQEILTQEYYDLTPVRKPLCEHCDFVPLCSKHPDYLAD